MLKKPRQVKKFTNFDDQCSVSSAIVTESDAALDSIQELRAEVAKQKNVLGELETIKQDTAAKRLALVDLDQNVTHLSRQASRAEDKLSQLRRQGTSRISENKVTVEHLHQQLIEIENICHQNKMRADRAETDFQRMEKEVDLEFEGQEKVL
jgi:predicted metalloendopeptidase